MPGTSFLVQFDRIVVNAMETNSGIFVGTNLQYGWSSHSKTNASFSGISGEGHQVTRNVNVIYDNDLIDTPIDDRDVFLSKQTVPQAS
ncbi:hypothetical protein ACFFNY_26125 [Paenibacillus hodogayensis]|uniref:Spore germination protein n=1 Tax=Paenibacillus hodogayensis TaxID=279208 RepID=A0ABV5W3L1_9BACL